MGPLISIVMKYLETIAKVYMNVRGDHHGIHGDFYRVWGAESNFVNS